MKEIIESALHSENISFLDVGPNAVYVPSMGMVVTFYPVKDVTVETESGLKFSVVPTGPAKTARKPTTSKPKASKPKAAPPSPPTPKEERPKPKPINKASKPEEPLKKMDPEEALKQYIRGLNRSQVWAAIEAMTGEEVLNAIPGLILPCKVPTLAEALIEIIRKKGVLGEGYTIIGQIEEELVKQGRK